MSVKVGFKFIEVWGESMEDAVLAYEKEPIEKGKIVFYGPSYFTRWSKKFGMRPLAEEIKGKSGERCIINRGFGSTCPEHHLYYYPRMIRPLAPKVLVYSFNANGSAFGYSLEESWELAERVIAYAMTEFPDIHIYLCSVVPRKKDYSFTENANNERFNSRLRAFCADNDNCFYIDIMKYEGMHRKDIYIEDGVHFNQDGYDEFKKVFENELRDELEKY